MRTEDSACNAKEKTEQPFSIIKFCYLSLHSAMCLLILLQRAPHFGMTPSKNVFGID